MDVIAAFAAFALVASAAASGARFRPGSWYAQLRKPTWTPPAWMFGPVWTLLYVAMAVAAWLAWRRGHGSEAGFAVALWILQLAANAAWSWLFFGRRQIGAALADLGVLLALIAATTAAFFRVDAVAGGLMTPYLAWTAFAGALNLSIWRGNRGQSSPSRPREYQ